MATVKDVEEQIQRVEGFKVKIRWHNGADVRSTYSHLLPYPYDWNASDEWTVQEWKDERFTIWYAGFKVDALRHGDKRVGPQTRLRNLRQYTSA